VNREKEIKRLRRIAKKELSKWQHLRLEADTKDLWFIDDQTLIWLERFNKCEKTLAYYRRLKKADKDEKEGKVVTRPVEYDIERLKETPIVDIVKHYGFNVKMSGVGRGYIKLRQEKTASCCLTVDKNTFHDFGSGEHGDVIDFVAKQENCGFQEACKRLTLMGY